MGYGVKRDRTSAINSGNVPQTGDGLKLGVNMWQLIGEVRCPILSLRGATVVCLVPARTDTEWWHSFAMRAEVRLLRGRLKFGESKSCAPFPSAIVVFRPKEFNTESADDFTGGRRGNREGNCRFQISDFKGPSGSEKKRKTNKPCVLTNTATTNEERNR